MCGIAAALRRARAPDGGCVARWHGLQTALAHTIRSRGPDQQGDYHVEEDLWLSASVLHIQGDKLVAQPHIDDQRNVLLWNGEVFAFRFEEGLGSLPRGGAGDTAFVSRTLQGALDTIGDDEGDGMQRLLAVVGVLSRINGPYAFVYYHRSSNQLFYGRDPFGRRSLLRRRCEVAGLLLCSSAADDGAWEELPVDGVRSIDVASNDELFAPWPLGVVRLCRPHTIVPEASEGSDAHAFLHAMTASVQRRVDAMAPADGSACRLGVLFSGGIDSVLLTLLLHRCLLMTDSCEQVDLINVAFDSGTGAGAPDRLAAVVALAEIRLLCPERQWKLVCVDVGEEERERHTPRIRRLICPLDTHMDLNIGTAFWFASRGAGRVRQFSDSEVSAALKVSVGGKALVRVGTKDSNEHFPGLAAGSFGRAASRARSDALSCGNEQCGRPPKASCQWLLCNRCCLRSQKSGQRTMGGCEAHRIRPNPKQMGTAEEAGDAAAAAGAAGDQEQLNDSPHPPPHQQKQQQNEQEDDGEAYTSPCRVLLVGIGADEQMAGYGRHRTCYLTGGAAALDAELNRDLERLWRRNLGRDDRCIGDNGKEAWFPFLDEQVVALLQTMPVERIADMSLPSGVGDKKVLREAARLAGLDTSASFVKRAIQFGTRIAKSTNMQYFGSHRKGKGDNKI